MPTDSDLSSAFQGLTPSQAKRLDAIIRQKLEEAINEFDPEEEQDDMSTDARGKIARARAAIDATTLPGRQVDKGPRDLATVEQELDRVSTALRPLYKNKSQYRKRIAELEQKNHELWDEHEQAKALQRQAELASRGPEIAAMEAQIAPLVEEYRSLQTFPSKNRKRLQELGKEIEAKSKELEGLQK